MHSLKASITIIAVLSPSLLTRDSPVAKSATQLLKPWKIMQGTMLLVRRKMKVSRKPTVTAKMI